MESADNDDDEVNFKDGVVEHKDDNNVEIRSTIDAGLAKGVTKAPVDGVNAAAMTAAAMRRALVIDRCLWGEFQTKHTLDS